MEVKQELGLVGSGSVVRTDDKHIKIWTCL